MSQIPRTEPGAVAKLLESGHVFLDVRSVPEFEMGHVPGAYNVPLVHATDSGMAPNPEFLATVERRFAKNDNIIVGCRSGGRSARAAELLRQAGYSRLSDMSLGWEGTRDAFGRLTKGYSRQELPIETDGPSERSYSALQQEQ